MKIDLSKFGIILTSRPAGKEAWLAFQPKLRKIKNREAIEIDFAKVAVLTPSWADEFLTPLLKLHSNRVKLLDTKNPSVKATLKILKQTK